jgi:HAD superfamily hydrolase (TIGR01509 family)
VISSATLSGIIFDMDGVLCDSESFIAAAAIEMFRETYRLEVTREGFAPFVGTGEDRFIAGVAEMHGIRASLPRDKQRTYAIYLELIKGKLQPLPGALEFVWASRRRGLRNAVATSADRIKVDGNLAEIGLPVETFDAIVTAEDVERTKPDPEIFLVAAERLGLPPGRCLVIEDAPNGLLAGKAAGCRCLGITTTFGEEELRAAGADLIAADLSGAGGLLDTSRAAAS